ncbi:hypothetical protein HNP46_004198 [Pseudomonas nitritireducens]|uniref:Uncharacterized protein n=1 Tax=Pseudomonas nitroreducens TaxID=46680 RepID=A0A7W7KM30_PSENT|nr:hypothetical protein [Pseudomonas nitritireducens]MBB4865317.1 hypothetical protein [Pseudomonas nitritireducens]
MIGEFALDVDAHRMMHMFRMHYYHVAQLREMKLGETLLIGHFVGQGFAGPETGVAQAEIQRVRGGFRFNATWTCKFGRASRPMEMSYGSFKLRTGNRITFERDTEAKAAWAFGRVCRFLDFIERHKLHPDFKNWSLDMGHRPCWRFEALDSDGYNKKGNQAPMGEGLEAIVSVAIRTGALNLR